MIVSVLAVAYITFFCYLTGRSLFTRNANGNIIDCFTGLAVHGILFTALSLLIPVGTIFAQVIFIGISGGLYLWRRPSLKPDFGNLQKHPLALTCFLVAFFLLLLLHSAPVTHPDTLIYHAQNIRWAAEYRAIPGIANLQYHFGLQSNMFIVSALFSFRFTGTAAISFANLAICTWLLLFIFRQLDLSNTGQHSGVRNNLSWFMLLVFTFWTFTQIRLSVTSGSPDFAASIYCWLCLFLFVHPEPGESDKSAQLVRILLLLCFTIGIKFSTLPVLLLLPFVLYRTPRHGIGKWILCLVLAILLLAPVITRNIIASGYPLFPSGWVALPVDWKVEKTTVLQNEKYIKAYARAGVEAEPASIDLVAGQSLVEWVPYWWSRQSLADKTLLLCLLILAPVAIILSVRRRRKDLQIILLISLAGTLFWLNFAPDPRFGYGFLIPVAAVGLDFLFRRFPVKWIPKINYLLLSILLISLLGYSGSRLMNYFTLRQLLFPRGVMQSSFHEVKCSGLPFVQVGSGYCDDLPLPCIRDCNDIIPRGATITDGFRAK
ncbi:MAG: hypothetical protein ABWZ25_09160 [Chitinophagaceae bacterium]